MDSHYSWEPFSPDATNGIRRAFTELFPKENHGGLAAQISDYWFDMLNRVWHSKPARIQKKDRACNPSKPLSRIQQKIVVIAYADSVYAPQQNTLNTLDAFLKQHFPSLGGLHLLPACQVEESRFNDGFFSQVRRNRIHDRFGTNAEFAALMEEYFSMADFVLNHVDILNPKFQAYLNGDDQSGECFYVFSKEEYQKRTDRGDFANIFRPRPFPLFTVFRRRPSDRLYSRSTFDEK